MASTDNELLDGIEQLTETVKSRILDRVIADLRAALKLGARQDGYTKSDSGLYGKYQKHDPVDVSRVLEAIKTETERLFGEYAAKCADSNESDSGEL
jgi:ABC-type tungstate transport system permease subunit